MFDEEMVSQEYYDVYKIEKGDNLFKISKKYNINPLLLSSLNGLNMDDYIYPDQELLIPKKGYTYYITTEGDTISIVADKFEIDQDKLLDNNTIYLLPGQLLVYKK